MVIIKTCCALVIKHKNMNHDAVAAIKRQVNSILRYLILLGVYNLVWRKNGLTDQMILLRLFLKKIKRHKSIQRA